MKKVIFLVFVVVLGCLTAVYFSYGVTDGNNAITIPEFPEPQLVRSYIPPTQVAPSKISVPVKLSIDDLQSFANRNLVRQYTGDTEYLDGTVRGKLSYKFVREGDVKVCAEKGKIKISLPIKFNVRFVGNVLAAIVRVPFSAKSDGELRVNIYVKPGIRRDWSIKTEAEVDFEWIKSPRINVVGIQIGLRNESDRFLKEAIRDNLYRIDDAINKEVRLREIMQREWDNLTVPIMAANTISFHIDPRSVAASPLEITEEEVALHVYVEAGLSLSMGMGSVSGTRKRTLPSLEEYVSGDESVNLNVKALLNYDALEQEAMKALQGLEINMGIASVTVKSIRIMGSGERLITAFNIEAADSKGTIYAQGEPYFDEETRVLSVKNFELDEGTRLGLIEKAAWLLRPVLMSILNGRLSWELGAKIDGLIDDARDIIASRELNDEIELKGTLKSAKFTGLRVTAEGIEIGLNLEGAVTLTYTPR